jgi:hypothetical protein
VVEIDVASPDRSADLKGLVDQARATSTVSNSITRGIPVSVGASSRR